MFKTSLAGFFFDTRKNKFKWKRGNYDSTRFTA